jgi:hypothetical protein
VHDNYLAATRLSRCHWPHIGPHGPAVRLTSLTCDSTTSAPGRASSGFFRRFSAFHFGNPCARLPRTLVNRIDPKRVAGKLPAVRTSLAQLVKPRLQAEKSRPGRKAFGSTTPAARRWPALATARCKVKARSEEQCKNCTVRLHGVCYALVPSGSVRAGGRP